LLCVLASMKHRPRIDLGYHPISVRKTVRYPKAYFPHAWQQRWFLPLICGVLTLMLVMAIGLRGSLFAAPRTLLNQASPSPVVHPSITPVVIPTAIPAATSSPSSEPSPVPSKTPKVEPSPKKQPIVQRSFLIAPKFQGKVFKLATVPKTQKVVALTFDDGPWEKATPQILEILKKNRIKATFFWIGKHLLLYPEVARQVLNDGHVVGNHTWSHLYTDVEPAIAAREIDNTSALMTKLVGVKSNLFRPPGGRLKNGLVEYATKRKYLIALWSVDPRDSHLPIKAEQIVEAVLKEIQPGGVILLHDGGGDRSATIKALPLLISQLRVKGYKFVTLPELVKLSGQPSKPADSKTAPAKTPPAKVVPPKVTPSKPSPLPEPSSSPAQPTKVPEIPQPPVPSDSRPSSSPAELNPPITPSPSSLPTPQPPTPAPSVPILLPPQ
jgi:peptidoglycan-N-acetylglucosamine deacetylase